MSSTTVNATNVGSATATPLRPTLQYRSLICQDPVSTKSAQPQLRAGHGHQCGRTRSQSRWSRYSRLVEELQPGVYERLITAGVRDQLELIAQELVERQSLDPADAHETLVRHLSSIITRALQTMPGGREGLERQVDITNQLISRVFELVPTIEDRKEVVDTPEVLNEILGPPTAFGPQMPTERPDTAFSSSALLVNGRGQPRVGSEVQRELASADRVDLLCAFIKWHGVRILEHQIDELIRRRRQSGEQIPLRVITTTYMGATEKRALDRLADLGAEIKISYETRMTRLHAKAWLFHRDSGYSTAYVGSSNLSKSALLDGLEWNVRLSDVEQGHLLDTFRATFDEYWEDPTFEPYDPSSEKDQQRIKQALALETSGPRDMPLELASLDVRPWGYQQEVLDELAAEREVHGRNKNLVVMATGTGKTVVAGLDYRHLRDARKVDSLLFVAHREEILNQSRATFRHILRDGSFGERLVGGERPTEGRYVFASIQSLARLDLDRLDPSSFDMVIVDEFHHAGPETKTYATLLNHLTPKILLGLTATPERADGQDILQWFDGRIAVELRLWEALERSLLAPFQYFGAHDGTDISSVRWKRGSGYVPSELTDLYTASSVRTRVILQTLIDTVSDVQKMRALGFCVSVEHAEYMARKFSEAGIPSIALSHLSSPEDRSSVLGRLKRRELNCVFAVDLFNEGIDLPEIDTVLFLRPTESATIFLQQLGRGLRLADDKPCLTVLDFIGNQNREFRFDLRYRALTGTTRRGVERELVHGFRSLPAGCHISLDEVASEIVLKNIRTALGTRWKDMAVELKGMKGPSLQDYLTETGLELDDIYRKNPKEPGGWAGLRRAAGFDTRPPGEADKRLASAISKMLHVDDLERLEYLQHLVRLDEPPDVSQLTGRAARLMAMAHFSIWTWNEPIENLQSRLNELWKNPARLEEIREVLGILRDQVRRVTVPEDPGGLRPLHIHARYSLGELLAAFGMKNPKHAQGSGVRWFESESADVFWFNLQKTESHFSPTTMYADRAISPTLFQWESQSTTSATSPTGERYINHVERGSTVHLFFRESPESDGARGVPPYFYAGPATYVSHSGVKPVRIIWKLKYELPADVFHSARVASA